MNALFLIGLTYRVLTKRFAVEWDTGAIAAVYVAARRLGLSIEQVSVQGVATSPFGIRPRAALNLAPDRARSE